MTPIPLLDVWVDTRTTRGQVVQYVYATLPAPAARSLKRRINTDVDRYPNMVAWTTPAPPGAQEARPPNNRSRLIPADVEEIRGRHADGERVDDLAAEFRVTRLTISRVIHGRSWAP